MLSELRSEKLLTNDLNESFSELVSQSYFNLKYAELLNLSTWSESELKLNYPITFQDIVSEKFALRTQIKLKNHAFDQDFESALTPSVAKIWADNEFKFNYQRLGFDQFKLAESSWLYSAEDFLNLKVYWTSTCQVAISCLLIAITNLNQNILFVVPWGAYWETLSFLKHLNCDFSPQPTPGKKWFYFLDSSVWPEATRLPEDFRNCIGIIFDTTCFCRDSLLIKYIRDLASQKQLPLYLVRSHLKLDNLGMEFGRLGTLAYQAPLIETQTDMSEALIWKKLAEIGKWFGMFAQFSQIYPFLFCKDFACLNTHWLNRIQQNHLKLKDFLSKAGVANSLSFFKHQLYCYVNFASDLSEQEFTEIQQRLSKVFMFKKIPHLAVASYPWDFVSITGFRDHHQFFYGQEPRPSIRISLGDLPNEKMEEALEGLLVWLNNIQSRHLCSQPN